MDKFLGSPSLPIAALLLGSEIHFIESGKQVGKMTFQRHGIMQVAPAFPSHPHKLSFTST